MAFADVNLAALAWQNRGLRYLLQDSDIPDFASQHLASTMIQAKGQQGNRQRQASATGDSGRQYGRQGTGRNFGQRQPAGQPCVQTGGRPNWQAGPGAARAQGCSQQGSQSDGRLFNQQDGRAARQAWSGRRANDSGQADQARQVQSGNASPASAVAPVAQAWPQYLPPEQWPPAWQQRLVRTRPGLIAWTYRELGRDFLAGNDPDTARRREFFGRLIRDLSHPAGTHTFWPACLPAQQGGQGQEGSGPGANQYEPRVFWSGLKKLGTRGIVVMDREVARAIGLPDSLRPLQQIMHNGFFVWFLWDAEVMSNDLERYGSMIVYLRSTLRMVVHS